MIKTSPEQLKHLLNHPRTAISNPRRTMHCWRQIMNKTTEKIPTENPDALFGRIVSILEQARGLLSVQ